jgi:hypothetical protein
MRSLRPIILAVLALAAVAVPRAASAAVELGLGADYLFEPQAGTFPLTLAVDTPLARHLTIGGRFGVLLLTDPSRVGIPLDFRLRARFSKLYVDGLVGPWILFSDSDPIRFHAGFGFGVVMRHIELGLEVGYLNPTGMLGLRLAFPF